MYVDNISRFIDSRHRVQILNLDFGRTQRNIYAGHYVLHINPRTFSAISVNIVIIKIKYQRSL